MGENFFFCANKKDMWIIPEHFANEIADEATEMSAYEDFVVEQVRAGETIIGLYPATKDENLAKFANWRKVNNR